MCPTSVQQTSKCLLRRHFFCIQWFFFTILLALPLAIGWMLNDSLSSDPTSPLPLLVWGCGVDPDCRCTSKGMISSPKQNNIICISRSQQISSFPAHLFEWKTPKSDLCFDPRVLNGTPESPAGSCGEIFSGATVSGLLELCLCCRCRRRQVASSGVFALLRFGLSDAECRWDGIPVPPSAPFTQTHPTEVLVLGWMSNRFVPFCVLGWF